MQLADRARYWNVTAEERAAEYPCQRYAPPGSRLYLRGVDIDADPATVFRWVCQFKVAPYSYDWLDNWGRRSPRTLTPGAGELAEGQLVMVGRIVEYEVNRHLTAISTPAATRVFGPFALSYLVTPRTGGARLLGCLSVGSAGGPLGRVRRELLSWGDLVMMRKQLLTVKRLAEDSDQ